MSPFVAAIIALAGLTLVKATPLIFAALGGVLSERSGVVNIGLEGIMIGGAFAAVCVSGATGSPFLGLLAGILAGALLAALLAYVSTKLGFDQIVAGTGLNIVALGAAAFGLVLVYGQPGASHEVPAFGKSGESALTILALVLAVALTLFLNGTPWGLRIRACGENPRAAAAAGIDPQRTRFWSVVAGGAIAALGGVYLALAELDLYSDGMTAGRGFISALQYTLQRAGIPSELMQALPYLAALVALAGLAGRVRAPAADGIPYVAEAVRSR